MINFATPKPYLIATGLALCLLLGACSMPPKYSQLIAPPEGYVAIYVYFDDLSKEEKGGLLSRKDFLSPNYRLIGLADKKQLTGGTAHHYVAKPGKLQVQHYLPHKKIKTYSIATNANDTIFVEFKLLKSSEAGRPKFQQQVFLFKQTANNQHRALVNLHDMRIASFDRPTRIAPTIPREKLAEVESKTGNNSAGVNDTREAAPAVVSIAPPVSEPQTGLPLEQKPEPAPTQPEPATTQPEPAPTQPVPAPAQKVAPPKIEVAHSADSQQVDTPTPATNDIQPVTGKQAWINLQTSMSRVSCSKPHKLSQDCYGGKLATRKVIINGNTFSAAGSADGSVVLLMGKQSALNSLKQFVTFGGAGNEESNRLEASWPALKLLLEEQGIKILTRTTIITSGDTQGYIIETDGNAYSVLK